MIRLLSMVVKTEYAVRALIRLAKAGDGAIITVKEMAADGDMSAPFLYSVFDVLERQGLVQSHKGKKRGFSLMRPAEEISFMEILQAMEGPMIKTQCLLNRDEPCPGNQTCAIHYTWLRIRDYVENELKDVSLAYLAHSKKAS